MRAQGKIGTSWIAGLQLYEEVALQLYCYIKKIFVPLCPGGNNSYLSIPVAGAKVTSAIWGPLDYFIIAGHEDGKVCQWDSKVVKPVYFKFLYDYNF